LETWQSAHGKTANTAETAAKLSIRLVQTLNPSVCCRNIQTEEKKNGKYKRKRNQKHNIKKELRRMKGGRCLGVEKVKELRNKNEDSEIMKETERIKVKKKSKAIPVTGLGGL
jgi:hypothetical protein